MDNLLYDTPNVTIALRLCQLASASYVLQFYGIAGGVTYEVVRAELSRSFVQAGVGREDRAATLTLVADYSTHVGGVVVCGRSVERCELWCCGPFSTIHTFA
jgi:hypothetical protein